MLAHVAGRAGTVGLAALSGWETAGGIGGVVTALAAAVTLVITVSANNRSRRREYENEIRAAEQRGSDAARQSLDPRIRNLIDELEQARHDRDFYRQAYIEQGGRPLPPEAST